jgi:hypothetical protein
MSKSAAAMLVLVLAASSIFAFLPVKAEAKTIVVPDEYSTISAAIRNANDGDTVFVKKGTYEGAINQSLTIKKAIFLIGEDASQTRLNLHPEWVTQWIFSTELSGYSYPIRIEANYVTISGFTITTDGGIIWVNGNSSKITKNILYTDINFQGSHQIFSQDTVYSGINFSGSYSQVFSNNLLNGSILVGGGSFNSIYTNYATGGGLHTGGASKRNLIYKNTVVNGSGISACYGDIVTRNTVTGSQGAGISIAWGFDNIIFGNTVCNNQIGLLKSEGNNNTFYANYVANNRYDAFILNTAGNTTLFQNNFIGNGQQVNTEATETMGRFPCIRKIEHGGSFDDGKVGNYWSDYNSPDSNADGVGDSPYVIDGSRRDNYPLMAPFNIDSITVELPEWANISAIEMPEPFPTTLIIAASGAAVAIAGVGLLVYFKKRER